MYFFSLSQKYLKPNHLTVAGYIRSEKYDNRIEQNKIEFVQ